MIPPILAQIGIPVLTSVLGEILKTIDSPVTKGAAIAYVIVFDTARSVIVLNAMGALSAIWAVGLSVLGIYVYKRSEEKKKNPDAPETIFWNVRK